MVSYNRSHYVFRILGSFGINAATVREEWSTGLRLGTIGSDVPVGTALEPFLEDVAPVIQAFHTNTFSFTGNNVWLRELTIARVGHDGKYDPAAQETTRRPYTTPVAGVGTPIHSWNTAMVISLRTAYPRGIASNGRTYWPTLAIPVAPQTGRIDQGQVDAFVDAAKIMMDGINDSANDHLGSLVRIGVFGQDGKTGSARVGWVDRIRSDGRLDSIERRENDQASVYSERSVSI